MKGSLFEYDYKGSIAYKNDVISEKTIVFINGLGGNILSFAYNTRLNEYCIKHNISLVIPQLRSMPNFQIAPIESDIEDLKNVLSTIKGSVVLMGHSTGCNDIILYLKDHLSDKIKGAVLQAPVSDPESTCRNTVKKNIDLINNSNQSNLYIELPNMGLWLKKRYLSLYSTYSKEDVFSSYLDDSVFSYWKDKIKILSVLSGADEFCKVDVSQKFKLMGDTIILENSNHAASSKKSQKKLIEVLDQFLKDIDF